MFETLFHEYGLITLSRSGVIRHGPSSWKSPISESEPGPPFNHRDSGSFAGSDLLSKNQKKKWTFGAWKDLVSFFLILATDLNCSANVPDQ